MSRSQPPHPTLRAMGRDREKLSSRSRDERKHQSSSHKKASKSKSNDKRRRRDNDSDDCDGPREMPGGAKLIGDDDYFLRATEFRVWLKQRRNKYVEELSTDEAMHFFQSKFVKRWNSGRLDRMFYEGIPDSVLESSKRTRHAWGFVKNLNDRERMDLATTKDSVGVATRKADLLVVSERRPERQPEPAVAAFKSVDERKRARADRDDDDDDRRHRRRGDDKQLRRHHNTVMDELAPRETGREALLEKRRQVSDRVHGAALDRDATRDGLDLDDDFLMGGSGAKDNLRSRLSHRADARQRRDQDLRDRAAQAQAKETARMDKFLEDMGISANSGRPITIQPRRDT